MTNRRKVELPSDQVVRDTASFRSNHLAYSESESVKSNVASKYPALAYEPSNRAGDPEKSVSTDSDNSLGSAKRIPYHMRRRVSLCRRYLNAEL